MDWRDPRRGGSPRAGGVVSIGVARSPPDQVVFDYEGRNGCTVDATTVDGTHRQMLVGSVAASDLAKTLRLREVDVKELRAGEPL